MHLAKDEDYVKCKTPLSNVKGMKLLSNMRGIETPNKMSREKNNCWNNSDSILMTRRDQAGS